MIDPKASGLGVFYVVRGGSWCTFGTSTRSSTRHKNGYEERSFDLGFRIAVDDAGL
ncbi:hypothetical protein [Thiothrix nivea]|uniref:hypothetical protein n=1 Tax=Thiothrix nivea TaxID=1031 RepID=UPI003CCAA798